MRPLNQLFTETDWAALIGWLIFAWLLYLLVSNQFLVNPFLVGFAYYCAYVLWRLKNAVDRKEPISPDLLTVRLFLVCVIALVSLWIAINHEEDKRIFEKKFERTCYQHRYENNEETSYLCSVIQSHIDNYLHSNYSESD